MAVEAVDGNMARVNVLVVLLSDELGHPHKPACCCLPVSSYCLFFPIESNRAKQHPKMGRKASDKPERSETK